MAKTKSSSKILIPFQGKTLVEYAFYNPSTNTHIAPYGGTYEWREPTVFSATLTLTGFGRGRSSVRFSVDASNGEKYSMTTAAFYRAVMTHCTGPGKFKGKWTFRKQGMNYTLWPVVD